MEMVINLVKEFPSTLESATSWLDIHENLKCTRLAVAGTPPRSRLSYSFACHVSCKVKYFRKVVNV